MSSAPCVMANMLSGDCTLSFISEISMVLFCDEYRFIVKELKSWTSVPLLLCFKVTQLCLTLWDPMDGSPPGSSVQRDSPGKNTEGGCHCPPPVNLPNPGIEPRSPSLQADSLPSESFRYTVHTEWVSLTDVVAARNAAGNLVLRGRGTPLGEKSLKPWKHEWAWLVGGMGWGSGREIQEGGGLCIHIAYLHRCIAETNAWL